MNILIFEAEKYDFDLLCAMLHRLSPSCNICGHISSVEEGKLFFADNREAIDLIIAEVKLTDGLVFHALADAPADIPVIFATAYDEYALQAFRFNSLSYLLKPVDEDELRDAIRKSQERLITDDHREELLQVLAKHQPWCERLFVKSFNGDNVVYTSQIRYFVSVEKTTYVKLLSGESYEYPSSLIDLEKELNPRKFMRVNRKYIVPLREVRRLEPDTNGKERLVLHGEDSPEIIVSRDGKDRVHKWLLGTLVK